MKYDRFLKKIYKDLKDGYIYAEWLENVQFPMWWAILRYDTPYISVRHYGQYSIKANLEQLKWVIEEQFKMTPREFIEKYQKVNRYDYENGIKGE